jgi:hypothetical protein
LTLPHDALLRTIGYRTVELQEYGRAVIGERALSG